MSEAELLEYLATCAKERSAAILKRDEVRAILAIIERLQEAACAPLPTEI